MSRTGARRRGAAIVLWAITSIVLMGAGSSKKKLNDPTPLKGEETLTDVATIISHSDMRLEGVGLVVGLDNTGADAPPSWYRDRLLDQMRKAGVEKPNKMLADPRFAMVIVRLKVPTGTGTTDRLDVELEVPPGCSTKTLAGGYLLSCPLKEIMIGGGTPKEGSPMAFGQGPVMVGTESKPDDPKVGRVLGGAWVKKSLPFSLVIKENHRSIRTSSLIQSVINQRFPLRDGVDLKGVASAKTDHYLELKVPQVYHHNHYRYFRVLKLLPMVDSPGLRARRMEIWGKELLDPKRSGLAALRLEGIGPTAVDTLKSGLKSPSEQVRFFAAEALAYLNDDAGAEILAENVVKRPEFRAYALDALAATDQSASRMKLIKLMDEPTVDVRYGAFNALRSLDATDPFLGRVRVLDEAPEAEEESESMSLAIAGAYRRRRGVTEDPFALYVVDCEGPPLIHVSRTKRCEIVVFGRDQKMLTPIVLGKGPILLNASDGDQALQISKILSSRADDSDTKVSSTLEIADVLRQTANLGARYPDVVSILQAAYKQKNLPGPLVVDAAPDYSAIYTEAAIFGKDATSKKDDALQKASHSSKKKKSGLTKWFRQFFDSEDP